MIFVTVGTQLPFDRLTLAVDDWARRNPAIEVTMQIGRKGAQPKHARFRETYLEQEWEKLFVESSLVVSHAGMGTILRCLDISKPLIVMPRKESLGEHRSDHQIATAERFVKFANIAIANNSEQLFSALDHPPTGVVGNRKDIEEKRVRLIKEVRAFLRMD